MAGYSAVTTGEQRACVAGVVVSVDAVNSVHGRHFVVVADGRLRASDKIMRRGEGVGNWFILNTV